LIDEKRKLPLSSVNVPTELPFTVTETAETNSFDLAFLTLPETTVEFWALALIVTKVAMATNKHLLLSLLILAKFGYNLGAK
jgi:hypothetical protein